MKKFETVQGKLRGVPSSGSGSDNPTSNFPMQKDIAFFPPFHPFFLTNAGYGLMIAADFISTCQYFCLRSLTMTIQVLEDQHRKKQFTVCTKHHNIQRCNEPIHVSVINLRIMQRSGVPADGACCCRRLSGP